MGDEIDDVELLESTVGSRPAAVMMKSITRLDEHCDAVLDRSTAAVMAWRSPSGAMRSAVIGGTPGFARGPSSSRVPLVVPGDAPHGAPVGLLVLTPGWKEMLRINGRVAEGGVDVQEALVHCGKAMLRSEFWSSRHRAGAAGPESSGERLDDAQREFLSRSRFVAIGSCDREGSADVSPKGDPAGFVQVIDETTLAIPDRPGNRRTDTLHNLLASPEVSLVAIAPGDDRTLEISGRASIRTDHKTLGSMAVKGKVPKVAIVIDVHRTELRLSHGIAAAQLWDPGHHVADGDLPRASRMWADHVKQSQASGAKARMIRAGANESVIEAGVQLDYQRNLY